MTEIPERIWTVKGFSLDRAPPPVVAFLRMFETTGQPLVGYQQPTENNVIASYGPEENRRTVQVVASVKIPFDVEKVA